VGEIITIAGAFRYRAFISYSHADQAVARWLHRSIESYRTPARLVGRTTASGLIGKRLGTVFRDRDELPVAADLSGQINDALKATQFLIVLCSKASARSAWVNQEVVNFKRLKGPSSIIAVILDGEPFASAKPGREADECFAPALRFHVDEHGALTDSPAEPIAADLRPGKDSKRLVKLKVIAGLLGVGLDELVRRENQRRTRQLFWLSTGMAAATLVMAVLTVNAIQARNDAERQKAQAESLIEFMLGDLRQKLEPVGRLDVLDSVGDRALKYFATLRADEMDADTLGRRSRALHLLGEIEDLRGNLDQAHEIFEEARHTTAELLDRAPNNPQRLYDHAQSVFWLGYVDWQRGKKVEGERAFREYQALAEHLATIDPGNVTWQKEVAYAYNHLGVLQLQDQLYAQARTSFETTRDALAKLAAAHPADQPIRLDLAQALSWLATTYRALGLFDAAQAEKMRELGLYDEILKTDRLNREVADYAILARISLGQWALEEGRVENAAQTFLQAETQAGQLAASDAENTEWIELSARTKLNFAEALLYEGNLRDARRHNDRALEMAASLVQRDAGVLAWQTTLLARAKLLSARIGLREKAAPRALGTAQALSSDLEKLRAAHGDDPLLPWLQAQAALIEGDALAALGRSGAAAKWSAALETVAPARASASMQNKITLAVIADRLGKHDDSAALLTELESGGIRHPELTFSIRKTSHSIAVD